MTSDLRKSDTKSHVELDLPGRLRDAVLRWLSSNEKAGPDVRWGAYPHGMVLRWIERAEAAEARVRELENGSAGTCERCGTTRARHPSGGTWPHRCIETIEPEDAGLLLGAMRGDVQDLRRELSSAQSTIASLRQDLDRISAEREAYREARSFCSWLVSMDEPDSSARRTVTLTQIIAEARRILAENDR